MALNFPPPVLFVICTLIGIVCVAPLFGLSPNSVFLRPSPALHQPRDMLRADVHVVRGVGSLERGPVPQPLPQCLSRRSSWRILCDLDCYGVKLYQPVLAEAHGEALRR